MKKILLSAVLIGGAFSAQIALAADAEELFKTKACVACHTVETKLVGPALKEVAASGKDAATLAASIKNGSQGSYGPIPMPPNNVTEDEANTLAEWVLSHK
ncbi:cytochrome C biogenesis protein CcsA [Thiopseudomonas alkaliphila]|uniref:Cytochrome c-551 n=1 Tax=Thiopseudomonas alkaliphila TaxID=1697053 RepID=A0A0K1XE88_9GAMM|nr:c-type cytochrome [Thiopseudomonas alkaliphila]AKX45194.1 cytochrome C biogenesis protein CcsA [Thiopseudomonas alkaliphila]AKX51095.1 cytochrome C biogenesis protein CcsA [Thiopseudomonas alkaliphila]AKX55402.1 cytochrome C biogenesis protein CcsA [Thiopseudomonas alkaliphila]AKX57461.1 cytochrome C biogenesis protein CcsA [Thiopseudomonas alkaliphila]AKX59641.1 cytochrome C biogenesis protein CcsA [Thiopseudomonas alkaliphila]